MSQHIACELRRCILHRTIPEGLSLVANTLPEIDGMSTDADLIELIAEISIWIDFDFALRDWVEQAIKRWPDVSRGPLRTSLYLLLLFAEATVLMHKEEFESAALGFRKVIDANSILQDQHLHLIANFYAARCRYYQAWYPEANEFLKAAGVQGQHLNDAKFQIAGIDILQSRIMLKERPLKDAICDATKLLEKSRAAFEPTEDHITKGNILTFLAQIAKRGPHDGDDAMDLLGDAIKEFEKHPKSAQPGEGRARVYRARLSRDRALDLQEQLNGAIHIERKEQLLVSIVKLEPLLMKELQAAGSHLTVSLSTAVRKIQVFLDSTATPDKADQEAVVAEILDLQTRGLADLDISARIFEQHCHLRSLTNVFTSRGEIFLDRRVYDEAVTAVAAAIEHGRGRGDTVLARAWNLVTTIHCTMAEDMNIADPSQHIEEARKSSQTALEHALKTNPRIVGLAHVLRGRALLLEETPTVVDRREAEVQRDTAKNILRKNPGGSLQRNYDLLQTRLNPGGKSTSTLQTWLETRSGASLKELEVCITTLAWASTGKLSAFIKALRVSYKKAYGLLKEANITVVKRISQKRKLPKREYGLGQQKQKRHHAG